MRIEVRNGAFMADPPVREYVTLRSLSVLGPWLPQLDSLVVCLALGNGVGARERHRCRVVGRLPGEATVLSEHSHADLYEAVDGAIQRLGTSLGKPRRTRRGLAVAA